MLISLGRRIVSHAWRPNTNPLIYGFRNSSTLSSASGPTLSDPNNVRNIALLAHIDSGKTTLTESILTASSYKLNAGTVDTGSTTTDFLPAERERGITIQSASIPVSWRQWTFNLIDTPGHADFGMEVESASRVVDGAVVLLDAVEGVESQTKGVWNQLDRHQVPTRFIFVNKLDRPGASLPSSILSILAHRLHPSPTLLTLPVASFDAAYYKRGEPGIEGLVDLVKWEVWKWPTTQSAESNHPPERIPLPTTESELINGSIFPPEHPLLKELLPAREALLDGLSLRSPELESAILDCPPDVSPYLSVSAQQIIPSLRSLVTKREILPVFCGAAAKHIGTGLLLDYVGELLASPRDVRLEGSAEIGSEVQMLAWKVAWDKRKGWMTFVRVYSGSLTRNITLVNTTTHEKERISKILLLYADEPREVDSLPFGSVGVLLGLKHTRTGDTLVAATLEHQSHRQHKAPVPKGKLAPTQVQPSPLALGSIIPPPAVISASVIPQAHADIQPVTDALLALSRTDPSIRITEDQTEGQTLVHGLGALHLEIAEGRLKEEWGVRVSFGKRRVTYREGFMGDEIEVDEVLERDVGGTKVSARVRLAVRSLTQEEGKGDPAWGGNVVSSVDGGWLQAPAATSETTAPVDPVLLGIQTALSASPHTSLALTRAHITILEAPSTNMTNPLAAGAGTQALRAAILEAGPGTIMEPFVKVRVRVGEEAVGRVVKDLTECGGEIADLGLESINDGEVDTFNSSDAYIPPAIVSPASGVPNTSKVGGAGVKRTVHAAAPLSQMLDYSNRLRAISAGTGQFEMESVGFREVSDVRRREILVEIGRA